MKQKLLFLILINILSVLTALAQKMTICNPMNLDYGLSNTDERHGADPVIVLFKDRYYLFDTWDLPGYRVSTNLIDWAFIPFDAATLAALRITKDYTAPAVATDGKYLYFLKLVTEKDQQTAAIIRTENPESGSWEKVSEIRKVVDPTLFFDQGKVYVYHGLMTPTKSFELDPVTFTEIPGSEKQLVPDYSQINLAGWESLTEGGRNWPCREGVWIFKRNGIYYLTYATPGTASKWYSDGVYTSNSPNGPFSYQENGPVSTKPGGFIGSAGHSCVFKDKYGNWWQISTMWIGVNADFERRIGLFPVEFDGKGNMHTLTELGDYPLVIPQESSNPDNLFAGWYLLTNGPKVSVKVSSLLTDHPAELAIDENVRTWWSAATGNAGEWLTIDLGQSSQINAVQVNFAEQDCTSIGYHALNDYHQYRLFYSVDNKNWKMIIDRSRNKTAVPHDYKQLNKPVLARFLKIENIFMAAGGKFAIRELRAFGKGIGNAPKAVSNVTVKRDRKSLRNCIINWASSKDANGYLVRYGISKDLMTAHYQTVGSDTCLWLHTLANVADRTYYFRVDAYNSNGITNGKEVVTTQWYSGLGPEIDQKREYQIVNRKSGKVAGCNAENNISVMQMNKTGTTDQRWKFELLSDGFYKITNNLNGKSMSVENASKNRKARILLADWTDADCQKWSVIFSEKGHIKLLNKNSNYYLEVPKENVQDKIQLEQSRYFDFDYQEWKLIKL